MTGIIILGIIILLTVVTVQIGKISELAAKLRGEEEVENSVTKSQSVWLVLFMVVFLVASIWSAYYYKNYMLGYGPMTSASEHGVWVDGMFNTTLIFTGIVFIITQILTFWYPFKYRRRQGVKAKFLSHDNTLELVWTLVPSIVLAYLVAQGLIAWNKIMPEMEDGTYMEIEATGYQFAWDLRLPGPDGKLGTKNIHNIDLASNPLGLDWSDDKSIDDIILGGADKLLLPVDTAIRVRINSKDVLHNFYLPHFRVKMDAVPGLPTYFNFRPTKTTAEFRSELRKYPEWNELHDPSDPSLGPKWKNFNYELACAELCGKGHYSMKRIIEIVSKDEFEAWKKEQTSYYLTNVRGTDADPRKNQLLDMEIKQRATDLKTDFSNALKAEDPAEKIILLDHVFYETASANLDGKSKYEISNLTEIMKNNPDVRIELRGHTDNVGDDDMNMTLSQSRAEGVKNELIRKGIDANRLVAKGYGETLPIDSNDTPEGRKLNRRTELKLLSK